MEKTINLFLFIYKCVIADTEIPILPQTPSPPPQQQQQQPAHQQHRNVQELQQQTHQQQQQQHPQNNGQQQQQQHRPLLHGLLSGTHIPQANYHRGYSSSSTGNFLSLLNIYSHVQCLFSFGKL